MPVSTFIMVLLPEPFGRIRLWIVPGFTAMSMSFSAFSPPNCISTLRMSSSVPPAGVVDAVARPERENDLSSPTTVW
ncbi:hypothetical protein [Bosea sp. PAMC 26642]|uniref:hypothetical protein n=1 Tax=Bosea sp. (strain PAMC 26642) TaxID=1792307 RepID=UPI0007703B4E|nr:hypothetical protein [Bosea sp. PAMC 26642]AMJ62843.1 hypothetical protein AXW83_23385 [Bosea sp. PAMC 26642]